MEILISGASTGIGRACAVHMASLGHQVWGGVRSQKSFQDLTKMNVRGLRPIFLDVTEEKSITDAVSLIKKESGTLHALVNNSGIAVGGPIEGLSLADWRRQFEVNFFGLIALTQACLPLLRESKGRIVNMSSMSGRLASPYLAPYASSKFALEAFSDSLRRELYRFGVQVAIIEPGAINTPIWKKSIADGVELKAEMSNEVMEVYGTPIDQFFKAMEKTERGSSPVGVVVRAVEHALLSRTPRTRYPVGKYVNLLTRAAAVLPDKWMDGILRQRI